MNKLSILSISFQAVFIFIWFQLQDQNMYKLQNNFLGSARWIKLWSACSEVCGSWHLLKEAAIPRWRLCWGPIIIGESILWLLIWRFPSWWWSLAQVIPLPPSILVAKSPINLLHPSSTHSLVLWPHWLIFPPPCPCINRLRINKRTIGQLN